METIRALNTRVQLLDAKGDYGHLGMRVAGGLMLFVFCPMSIMAVAAPYWTASAEMQGHSMSIQVSLWKSSTEINGASADQALCGDVISDLMSGSDECGKIHAVRFFTIMALLLSLASGALLAVGFSPTLAEALLVGASFCSAVLLCDFLGICIAASVAMTGESSLNGAGFVFLILDILFVGAAMALVACTLTRWSTKVVTMDAAPVVKIGFQAGDKSPTLLSSPQTGTQKPKMTDSNVGVPEESEKNVEKSSANAATVVVARQA